MCREATIRAVRNKEDFVHQEQHLDLEAVLKERDQECEAQREMIDEMHAALKVLLENRERERTEFESSVVANVRQFTLPVLEKLKNSGLAPIQEEYLDLLETSLHRILSPFLQKLNGACADLTTTEHIVANLVKEGKSSKEIAEVMNLSLRTVDTYRNRMRKKLGISRRKVNLRVYLLGLENS